MSKCDVAGCRQLLNGYSAWIVPVSALVIVSGAVTLVQAVSMSSTPKQTEVVFRESPIPVIPHGDYAQLVSDQDLRVALIAAHPYWEPPRAATALHALRLWGIDSTFPSVKPGQEGPSGRRFLKAITDEREFDAVNPEEEGDLLKQTSYGIRVVGGRDALIYNILGAGHVDQLLKVLADAGAPLSTPIRADTGYTGTVRELLADSIARFSIEQEMEFTALAFCRWLPPQTSWTNRFGRTYTFDNIAQCLCNQKLGSGSCNGVHVFHALTLMLAVHDQTPILGEFAVAQIRARLHEVQLLLEANELTSGGWSADWAASKNEEIEGEQSWSKRLSRISSTGHHLEWMAQLPDGERMSAPIIQRAVQALIRDIKSMSPAERENFKHFWPLSHAARALALMRGSTAWEMWQKLELSKLVLKESRRPDPAL